MDISVIEGLDPIGAFFDLIASLVRPILDWLINFLPDGDASIFAAIDSIGQLGASMTFNVFYFIDFSAVLLCFGVLITVMLIVNVTKLILMSGKIAASAVEVIPIVE